MHENDEVHTLNFGSQYISYTKTSGNGPVLILIHGNSSSIWSFTKQIKSKLGADHSLYAIELPGHGKTPKATGSDAYSLPYFRNIIKQFVEALDLEECILVGHSMGAHIALEMLPVLPKIKGVVLFGALPISNPPKSGTRLNPMAAKFFKKDLNKQEIDEWAQTCFAEGFSIPSQMYHNIKNADPLLRENLAKSVIKLEHFNELEILATTKVPVAIFHGELDPYINVEDLKSLDSPSRWEDIKIIKGAGHYAHYEKELQFNHYLDLFAKYCYR